MESHFLGLSENRDKIAMFHAIASGRRMLLANGVEPAHSPKMLGVELQGAKQRKNTPKDETRIRDSHLLMTKSSFVPLTCFTVLPMSS